MQEKKDPAIKLFGQKIPFPGEGDADAPPPIVDEETVSPAAMDVDKEELEDFGESETEDEKDKDPGGEKVSEKTKEADTPPNGTDEESAKLEKEENKNNGKTLKKPDKILACPRCKSMDTKFCYYNNYNVNQPRYFCKACQRYWTAGGTMRNVPVGAGRRKNKNSASHYRHISISEALEANGTHLLKPDGRVLSFGLDPPICDSMASVLNLREENDNNGDDCSSASSITVSNEESAKSTPHESMVLPTNNGFIHNVPCISTLPWPYPMCPPGFPMSFYPAPFWNIPWFPSQHSPHSAPPPPSTLGKHSRDDLHQESPSSQRNGSVLVPKTLRIDDPTEAAKSSIWATLGIKNERVSVSSVSGGGMFKGFQSKKDHNHVVEASPVLRANPAALSRSLNFHENS